jgi:Spy/CpxP family protein refolding chaperone
MKKTFLALAAVSLALPAMPAAADPPPWAHADGYRHHQREAARR